MKKLTLFSITILLATSLSFAQYQEGKQTAGALIGIGGGGLNGTGAVPIAVEYNFLNFEKNIHFGVFGAFATSSEDYGWGFGTGKFTYTNIIIAAQGNYHFMPGKQIDPFLGLSLGYNIVSSSWDWGTINKSGTLVQPSAATAKGFFWNIQAGANYWFSPKWAAQLRVGYFPYVGLGVTMGI
ncbi:MAG: outer membrane beta-barrel protein [Melioribacteraceae bacterium]